MLSWMRPVSSRAIISSALKTRIRLSASSIEPSSAVRSSSGELAVRKASSARLRSRVSGVFRSWAMLSETCCMPAISSPMRSSMALRLSARRSSSSPVPEMARRPFRSPAMIDCAVPVMSSMRFSTRRATNQLARQPRTKTTSSDQPAARRMTIPSRSRSSTSRPTSRRKPAGSTKTRTIARLGRSTASLVRAYSISASPGRSSVPGGSASTLPAMRSPTGVVTR